PAEGAGCIIAPSFRSRRRRRWTSATTAWPRSTSCPQSSLPISPEAPVTKMRRRDPGTTDYTIFRLRSSVAIACCRPRVRLELHGDLLRTPASIWSRVTSMFGVLNTLRLNKDLARRRFAFGRYQQTGTQPQGVQTQQDPQPPQPPQPHPPQPQPLQPRTTAQPLQPRTAAQPMQPRAAQPPQPRAAQPPQPRAAQPPQPRAATFTASWGTASFSLSKA